MNKEGSMSGMDVVKKIAQRAKEVLLKPRDTFRTIKTETVTPRDLILNYLAPLAIIPAVASIIGRSAVGIRFSLTGILRVPLINSFSSALLQYILTLIGIYILGLIINALAPSFLRKKKRNPGLEGSCLFCYSQSGSRDSIYSSCFGYTGSDSRTLWTLSSLSGYSHYDGVPP